MDDKPRLTLTGVGYIAQIEHEYMNLYKLSVCNNCFALGFQKKLRRCNGCKIVDYCSKECQKAHWKRHKGFCNMAQGKGAKNGYLSCCPRDDVFQVLIDSYRLRTELDHSRREENHGRYYAGTVPEGMVWANGDATEDFQRYLDLAEDARILPEWWRFENRMQCLTEAVDESSNESVFKKLDQEQLVTKYGGDTAIHPALCMLSELVVGYDGKGPAKSDQWFHDFQEYLDLHPQERAKLIQGTIDAVKDGLKAMGQDIPAALLSYDP